MGIKTKRVDEQDFIEIKSHQKIFIVDENSYEVGEHIVFEFGEDFAVVEVIQVSSHGESYIIGFKRVRNFMRKFLEFTDLERKVFLNFCSHKLIYGTEGMSRANINFFYDTLAIFTDGENLNDDDFKFFRSYVGLDDYGDDTDDDFPTDNIF